MTTPDPIELFKVFKNMSKQKVKYVVMEVSAHAIALNKINAINFTAKAITNITEDHLDFFESMENYAKTKLNFIKQGNCLKAVNIDADCCKNLPDLKNMYTYSKQEKSTAFANAFATSSTKT